MSDGGMDNVQKGAVDINDVPSLSPEQVYGEKAIEASAQRAADNLYDAPDIQPAPTGQAGQAPQVQPQAPQVQPQAPADSAAAEAKAIDEIAQMQDATEASPNIEQGPSDLGLESKKHIDIDKKLEGGVDPTLQDFSKAEAPKAEDTAPVVSDPKNPDWKPNYTFKAFGKEYSFPEEVKPLVNNKEREDYYRTMLSRAYGLDGVQANLDKATRQNQELTSQMKDAEVNSKYLLSLAEHVKSGNVDHMLRALQLSPEQINDFALKRAQQLYAVKDDQGARLALEDTFKKDYDNVMLKQRLEEQQRHQQESSERQIQEGFENWQDELNNRVMTDPEVRDLASEVDQFVGSPDSLKYAVNKYASEYLRTRGEVPTVALAVTEVGKYLTEKMKSVRTNNVAGQKTSVNRKQPARPAFLPNVRKDALAGAAQVGGSIDSMAKLDEAVKAAKNMSMRGGY